MAERKKDRRDRKDAWYLGELDSMHKFMPYLLPNRADNEAVMVETIDLTAVEQYLAEKNADDPEFKYTIFHVICAAIAKVFALRPQMNRFVSGHRVYERKNIVLTFVVKKKLEDGAAEAMAIITMDKDSDVSPLEQIYSKVKKIVYDVRVKEKKDGTTDYMDKFVKLPRGLLRILGRALIWMDYHGIEPTSFQKEDPYYSSIFISNLGSIKLHASYHHLANYGSNSFFAVVGEKHPQPFFQPDGSYEMRQALELGLTIDERISDGTYYAKSIQLLREILANPWLLDEPIMNPVKK